MSHEPIDVIAVIPAYQAAPTLAAVVRATAQHLPVLVVDDGSTDGTSGVAREAGAEVLRQEPNQGKGAALRRGFAHALDGGASAVLTLDADGQHDPACVPDFLAAWRERGAPLIIGRRDFAQMPFSRRVAEPWSCHFEASASSKRSSNTSGSVCPGKGPACASPTLITVPTSSRVPRTGSK